MSQITAVIFDDAEKWLRENCSDLCSDAISAVQPVSGFNPDGLTLYEDTEENTRKSCDLAAHVAALKKMSELIEDKKLFVGGVKCARDLVDPCNWDIEVTDAFWQLVYHGEVIYG